MTDRPRYVPTSTYRLQVHAAFPLLAARDTVPYLARLGVTTCYTSPYFTAAPGSTHGYDVVNHNEISPELGGAAAHAAFTDAIAAHHMGHIVDFVPNHMGVGTGTNPWWNDVLENGPSSPAAGFFDVEWAPVKTELHGKLLLPILGDQYGKVLERGELQLIFDDGRLSLRYFDHVLPINAREAARVYRRALEPLTAALGEASPRLHELQSIIASLENLPPYTEQQPERIAERQREPEVARARLARLVVDAPTVGRAVECAVKQFNGEAGRADSFDALHDLLERLPYRLAHWRTASHEINYRRFFDVNTLAGLRVENPDVFAAIHRLLGSLLRGGKVHGVRVDHPDGLFDPAAYFERLQALAESPDTGAAARPPDRPLYAVAEKILSGSERLPRTWAVHGTTGYNYLNDLNGIFVLQAQARRMWRTYAKLTGRDEPFDDVLYASKRLIMETAMTSELNVLANQLDRIGEGNRKSRDFTLDSLRDVITEVVACFPVYRTYVDESGWAPDDRAVVERAITRARRRNPAMESSLFDFFREVVLPRDPADAGDVRPWDRRGGYPPADAAEAHERLRFAMKLQQYSGPVQAKGLEDTAFYRYNVLLSLNEVGGDPERFGRSSAEFHQANERRLRDWPLEMIATSTHDTKLGEDVRARLNVLSEMPDEWSREAAKWMRINRPHRGILDGEPAPDRNDEYRFYQALLGVWPTDLPARVTEAPAALVDRLKAYMEKAVKEAKVHTSWLTPNQDYENAAVAFIERVLTGAGGAKFLPAFLPFQQRVARRGVVNSLAQLALKIGSPGVPDFYQGTELWDLTLVDPDNRRPVDFALRAQWLAEADAILSQAPAERRFAIASLRDSWYDGRIKLLVTTAGLRLRRERPDLFLEGVYLPLATEVSVNADVVAFVRLQADRSSTAGTSSKSDAALFVAPRLCAAVSASDRTLPLGEAWKTSRVMLPPQLAEQTFRDELTGIELRPVTRTGQAWLVVGHLFELLPIAILRTV